MDSSLKTEAGAAGAEVTHASGAPELLIEAHRVELTGYCYRMLG